MKKLAYDSLEEITSLSDLPDGECTFCCPFCPPNKHDGKRKLSVNFSKNLYHCWRCNSSGKATDLLREFSSINSKELGSYAFKDFDKSNRFHFKSPNFIQQSTEVKTELFAYDNIAVKILTNNLPNAHEYLNKRGITDEEIEYYDIRVGLETYRGRILIPTFDDYGNVTYFVARDYLGTSPMKYFNAKDTNKSEHVWNLNNAKEGDKIIITEGCFSGISANRIPDMTAVCTFGKALSEKQAQLIANKHPSEIIMSLDGDVSEKETIRDIQIISNYYRGLITIAHLPAGKDPNEMTLEEYQQVINDRTTYVPHKQFLYNIFK